MNLQELKAKKKKAGMSNSKIAELSGIPLSTVNKIFSGTTKNPRHAAVLAIEEVLATRRELIDGKLYALAAPSRMHQWLVSELFYQIKSYIRERKGGCQAYTSPFDVRLFGDDSVVVQPDILVACQKEILTNEGCSGAPDWLIEVVSTGNSQYDYLTKLIQYQKAGVREYWIVDPFERKVSVMNFENPALTGQFSYEDQVCSGVLEGFSTRMREIEETF